MQSTPRFVSFTILCLLPIITHSRFGYDVEQRHTRHQDGWTFPKSPVLNHHQFGVQHLIIPGFFDLDGEQRSVLLLVYLKACLAANNTMIWHGRVIAYDPLKLTLHLGQWPHHETPHDIRAGAHPTFALQRATMGVQHARNDNANNTYMLQLVQSHKSPDAPLDAGKPWVLRGQTPWTEEHQQEFFFCVNDWAYTALISEEIMELPSYIAPHVGPPTVHVVVKPMYGHPPHKAVQHVAFLVDHYAALGFNNTILYERGTYIRHLHAHDATAKQLHQGSLKLMLWDHGSAFAPMVTREAIPDDPHFPQYDELNVYEHAMTVLYGMNAYVFIVDMDEFLVLGGPPSTVHSALDHGCFATGSPAHMVDRFSFSECLMKSASAFLACAAAEMDQGKGQLLKFESELRLPKTLYFVDDVYSVSVHYARSFVFASDGLGDQVPPDCAYVVHANNVDWDTAL